jgi:hypothetical protein
MADLVGVCVAAGFAIVGSAGIVYASRALRLFRGDVMEQLFRFMAAGFLVIVLATLAEAGLLVAGQTIPTDVLGLALMAPFAIFLIGLICLIDWNERAKLNNLS